MTYANESLLAVVYKKLNENLASLKENLGERVSKISDALNENPSLKGSSISVELMVATDTIQAIESYNTDISTVCKDSTQKLYEIVEQHWKTFHDNKEREEFVYGPLNAVTQQSFIMLTALFDKFAQIAGFFEPYIKLPTKPRPVCKEVARDKVSGCRRMDVGGAIVSVVTDGAGYEYIPLTVNPYDPEWKSPYDPEWKSPIYDSSYARSNYVFNGRCCDAIQAVEDGYADATVSLRNRRDMSMIYPIIYLDPEIGRQKRLEYIKSIRETPSIRGWTLEFAEKSPMGGYVSKPLIMSGQFAHLFPATKFFVQDRKLAEHAKNTIIKLAELTAEEFFANAPKTVDGMYDALSMFLAENNLQNEGYANLYVPLVLGMISDSFDNYSLSAWKEKYSLEVVQCISEDWHS